MMKEGRPDVVKMAKQSEETSFEFVVPDFDLIVIPTRYKERLLVMEADTSNRAIVFIKFFQEGAHPIIPQLYNTTV